MTPTETRGRAYFVDRPSPATVEATPMEKIQVAVDRLFGVEARDVAAACEFFSAPTRARLAAQHGPLRRVHEAHPEARAESLAAVYVALTGDRTLRCNFENRSVRESQEYATWSSILANTLERRLLIDFASPFYNEFSIASRFACKSFRTQRVVTFESAGDLPDVDPQQADYVEQPPLQQRESTFEMQQKGRIISISRRTLINDDVRAVEKLVRGNARAARRTLAKEIWKLWTTNATFADSTAWFASGHNNLQTSAISKTEVSAALDKLRAQTEPGSGEKFAFPHRPGTYYLDVPEQLRATACALNQETGSELFGLFGSASEFVNVNPLLTDSNDWGVHFSSNLIESIAVHFLNGREEPEFLLADSDTAGAALYSDKQQWKVRFEFGVGLSEYRAAVKAIVP